MSNTELLKLEEEVAEWTATELQTFWAYLIEASDEQFQDVLNRKMAAQYVRNEVRDHISSEVYALHEWINAARLFYCKGLKDERGRAAFRSECERSHRFFSRESGHSE